MLSLTSSMAIMDLQASRENTDAFMSMWRKEEREREKERLFT